MAALQTLREIIASEGSISIVKMILAETTIYTDVCRALAPGIASSLVVGLGQTSADLNVARLELILEMCCSGKAVFRFKIRLGFCYFSRNFSLLLFFLFVGVFFMITLFCGQHRDKVLC